MSGVAEWEHPGTRNGDRAPASPLRPGSSAGALSKNRSGTRQSSSTLKLTSQPRALRLQPTPGASPTQIVRPGEAQKSQRLRRFPQELPCPTLLNASGLCGATLRQR